MRPSRQLYGPVRSPAGAGLDLAGQMSEDRAAAHHEEVEVTWYEFLLFVHVSGAIIWIGGAFLFQV
jgi:hypothetical protein